MKLILASQSPRRREILERAGFEFQVRVAGVVEELNPGESPRAYVQRLARAKAEAIDADQEAVVLGADTVVVLDHHLLEKPRDGEDATRMLRLLSGRAHSVQTGICLRRGRQIVSDIAETRVFFSRLTDREIAEYVQSGEPMDKAGAYAIQGLASKLIERIEGCYFNVVGLPISLVYRRLREVSGT